MMDDIWKRFDDPENYEGDYVEGIAKVIKTLTAKNSALKAVTSRFRDYKEERLNNLTGYDSKHNPIAAICELDGGGHYEIDGSARANDRMTKTLANTPLATIMLYELLWEEQIFCSELEIRKQHLVGLRVPPNNSSITRAFCMSFKSDALQNARVSGDVINSFSQIFISIMGCSSRKEAWDEYKAGRIPPKISQLSEQLKTLAYLTHTGGNLIPMPGSRSESKEGEPGSSPNHVHEFYHEDDGVHDRWDLFMEDIAVWFNKHQKATSYSSYYGFEYPDANCHEERGELKPYMRFAENENGTFYKWLDCFADFGDFVKKNYLQDYVQEGPAGSLKVVRYDRITKGDNTSSILDRLTQMNAQIIARNIRMREDAKNKGVDEDTCKFLFGW